PFHAAAREAGGDWRERLAVRVELGRMSLPQRVAPLPPHSEIVADPEVALAVEHRLAARAIAAAIEFQRQHPWAGRQVEIRHVRHRPQILALRDRVELAEQRKESIG